MNTLLTFFVIFLLVILFIIFVLHSPIKKNIPPYPLPKQDVTHDELYDNDYLILSTAIEKAKNGFQVRMAKCAVRQFKQRNKNYKNKASLDYDVDDLLDQCENQLILINTFPKS